MIPDADHVSGNPVLAVPPRLVWLDLRLICGDDNASYDKRKACGMSMDASIAVGIPDPVLSHTPGSNMEVLSG